MESNGSRLMAIPGFPALLFGARLTPVILRWERQVCSTQGTREQCQSHGKKAVLGWEQGHADTPMAQGYLRLWMLLGQVRITGALVALSEQMEVKKSGQYVCCCFFPFTP